jgi:hypothetical protein
MGIYFIPVAISGGVSVLLLCIQFYIWMKKARVPRPEMTAFYACVTAEYSGSYPQQQQQQHIILLKPLMRTGSMRTFPTGLAHMCIVRLGMFGY